MNDQTRDYLTHEHVYTVATAPEWGDKYATELAQIERLLDKHGIDTRHTLGIAGRVQQALAVLESETTRAANVGAGARPTQTIFEKCYKGANEGWFEVDEAEVKLGLADTYFDINLAIEEMRKGHTVYSQYAMYRIGPDINGLIRERDAARQELSECRDAAAEAHDLIDAQRERIAKLEALQRRMVKAGDFAVAVLGQLCRNEPTHPQNIQRAYFGLIGAINARGAADEAFNCGDSAVFGLPPSDATHRGEGISASVDVPSAGIDLSSDISDTQAEVA